MASTQQKQDPEVLVFEEAAEFLRTSPRKLWELVQAGNVPYFKLGQQYRFTRTELQAWMKQQIAEEK